MFPRRTLAVVVRVTDYGEADKIVTCYCPETGKLTGIAKGAKRSKKRFVNKLELFTLLELEYTPSRRSTLVRLDQAELLNGFPALRQHYDRYTGAVLLCELILNWTRENDGDEEVFALLVWAMEQLAAGGQPLKIIVLFQIKLLGLLGYRPYLAGCLGCGQLAAERAPYRFSTGRGGLLCAACRRESEPQSPLSLNTAKLLLKAQDLPSPKLSRLQFSKGSTREAAVLLKKYGCYLLQREIQAWDHLELI